MDQKLKNQIRNCFISDFQGYISSTVCDCYYIEHITRDVNIFKW